MKKQNVSIATPNSAPFSLSGAAAVSQAIAARDNNNLYRTSCFFRDVERYRAFCAYYAVMRVVDDRIDALPSLAMLTTDERAVELGVVDNWQRAVSASRRGKRATFKQGLNVALDHPQADDLLQELSSAFYRFPMPSDLWVNFFEAMRRDIDRARFATYQKFLQYTEGATVSPTTIYLFLLAAQRQGNGQYRPPAGFDLIRSGRALGLFAYLGHILRDLPDDLAVGEEGILFLAADDMRRFHLTETMLFKDLTAGRAGEPLRNLAAELVQRARTTLVEGQQVSGITRRASRF